MGQIYTNGFHSPVTNGFWYITADSGEESNLFFCTDLLCDIVAPKNYWGRGRTTLFAFRVVFILYEDRNLPELVCENEPHLHMNSIGLTIPTTGNFSGPTSNLYIRVIPLTAQPIPQFRNVHSENYNMFAILSNLHSKDSLILLGNR